MAVRAGMLTQVVSWRDRIRRRRFWLVKHFGSVTQYNGDKPQLILGSASPRRRMLLNQIGLEFSVVVPDVDEAPVVNGGDSGSIESQVIGLAEAKVQAVVPKLPTVDATRRLVIGADTIVLIDGQVLGKPVSHQDAVDMLRLLAGRTHAVYTGVTVLDLESGQVISGAERTAVTFTDLSEPVIQRYVTTGEPMDKAGAYAVQGLGSVFIARIEGCYFNVVGLPLALLGRLLKAHGYDVVDAW